MEGTIRRLDIMVGKDSGVGDVVMCIFEATSEGGERIIPRSANEHDFIMLSTSSIFLSEVQCVFFLCGASASGLDCDESL